MSDSISRQAAIDAFGLSEKTRKYGGDHSGYDTRMLYEIQDTLENLPAAQPDHNADVSKKVAVSCGQENDLISRQAAIDALARMMPRSYTPDGSHPADEEIFRVQEVFVDCIEALEILPSAQPATSCSEIPNGSDDTISRQAAIDALDCINGVEEVLRSLPSAQSEIIRCKDCDWWTKQEDSVQGRCELMRMYPAGGWYCGNARRRPK